MRILLITAAFLAVSLAPVLASEGFTGDLNSKPPPRRPPAQRRELRTASRTSAVCGTPLCARYVQDQQETRSARRSCHSQKPG